MSHVRSSLPVMVLFASVITILAAGCPKKTQETASSASPSPEVAARLAKADAADGSVDMVVSKCAGCGLTMDGSHEHSLQLAGYTMHFCSSDCQSTFGKDSEKSVLALKIPEGGPATADTPAGEKPKPEQP